MMITGLTTTLDLIALAHLAELASLWVAEVDVVAEFGARLTRNSLTKSTCSAVSTWRVVCYMSS